MPTQHIALFRFKAGTTPETISKAFNDLGALAQTVPGVLGFNCGVNNSPEGLSEGLSHAFVMTFRDAAARDAYLPHPDHQKFITFALPHIDRVVVVDYDC